MAHKVNDRLAPRGEFKMPKEIRSPNQWQGLSGDWFSFAKRVSSSAEHVLRHSRDGVAIVHAVCLVDADGEVLFWLEPRCMKAEPASKAKDTLMDILATFGF